MCPTKRTKSVHESLSKYRAKRDFEVTAEPSGNKPVARSGKSLAFVIQKHAASHLHFDLRLEVDGVMKSWAVPKGPSVDTEVKRLAMEVEDHPIAYNTFEGTIPQGEYGGGTVMLWDRGTYSPDEVNAGETDNDAARRALKAGKLAFTFHGERLHGSYALVRTRRGEERSQWLLFKHKDKYAKAGRDIVAEVTTSVDTGRTMEAIAAGDSSELRELDRELAIAPMQPAKGTSIPAGEYAIEVEPEGTRVLVFLTNGTVRLAGDGKHKAFDSADALQRSPKVAAELLRMARKVEGAVVLDAYLSEPRLTAVDLLLEGDELLVEEPWIERRARLDTLLDADRGRRRTSGVLPPGDWTVVNADDVRARAQPSRGEAIIAKRIDAPYESGSSKYWLRIQ